MRGLDERPRRGARRARQRGSRLALYDLRETLEAREAPLPVEFLAALSAIGDASCLEADCGRLHAASRTAMTLVARHLADAFQAIVAREGITRGTR